MSCFYHQILKKMIKVNVWRDVRRIFHNYLHHTRCLVFDCLVNHYPRYYFFRYSDFETLLQIELFFLL